MRSRDPKIIVVWVAVAAAGGCATTYRPLHPEVARSDDTQVELLAIKGGDVLLQASSASGARLERFQLGSRRSPPCSPGAEAVVVGVGGPFHDVTVRGERRLVLTSIGGGAALADPEATVDLEVVQQQARCLRLPVTGETGEDRWVAGTRWSLVGDLSLAPNFAPGTDRWAWTVSLEPRLWIDRVELGVHGQLGTLICSSDCGKAVVAGGPLIGARLLRAGRWAVDADAAYEVGGIQSVGLVHGPRLELAVLRSTRPAPVAFRPEFLFAGYGLVLAGGHWFVPSGEAPGSWYESFGFTVALGL